MIDPLKCLKLVQRLECMVSTLEDNNEYAIHFNINQFFYMQRAEELRMMVEQFRENGAESEAAARRMDESYVATYHQWRKDIRWLNTYLHNRNTKSIL